MRRFIVLVFRVATRAIVIVSLVLCILSAWLWYRAGQGHRAIARYVSRDDLPTSGYVSVSDPRRDYWMLDAMIDLVEGEEPESLLTIGYLRAKAMDSRFALPAGLEWDTDYRHGLFVRPMNISFLFGLRDSTIEGLSFNIRWLSSQSTTWNPGEPDQVITFYGVIMPTSHAILAFAVLPYVWYCVFVISFIRRRRKRRLGLCAKCGYDLRGTAPERACPECGAVRAPIEKVVTPAMPSPDPP